MNAKSKRSLLLIEIGLLTLFFTISVAICVNVFVNARVLSKKSEALNACVLAAQSMQETIKANISGGREPLDGICDTLPEEEGTIYIYYDKTLNDTTKENAEYTCELTFSEENGMLNVSAVFIQNEEIVYSLETQYWRAAE